MSSIRIRIVGRTVSVVAAVAVVTGLSILHRFESGLRGAAEDALVAEARQILVRLPRELRLSPDGAREPGRPARERARSPREQPRSRGPAPPPPSPEGGPGPAPSRRNESVEDDARHVFVLRHPLGDVSSRALGPGLPDLPDLELDPVLADRIERSTVRFDVVPHPLEADQALRLGVVVQGPPERGRRRDELAPRPEPLAALFVYRDLSSVQGATKTLARTLLAAGIGGVLLVALLTRRVVREGLRPLEALGSQLDGLDAARLESRVALERTPTELVPVVDELNALLTRLEASFAREQAFLGDAAHELRNPIAGLRATLELAAERERPHGELVEAVTESLATTKDLQHLVERLFELAASPSPVQPSATEEIALEPAIRAAWTQISAERRARGALRIESHDGPLRPFVRADPTLLGSVLVNVLDNALSHGPVVPVPIEVRLQHAGASVLLEISNPCEGLGDEDAARAFEPLWRADRARSGDGAHAGLGLALVRKAVSAMGGDVEARLQDEAFVLSLTLPAAADPAPPGPAAP